MRTIVSIGFFLLFFQNLNGQCCELMGNEIYDTNYYGLQCDDGYFCIDSLNCNGSISFGTEFFINDNGTSINITGGEFFPMGFTAFCVEQLSVSDDCSVQSFQTTMVVDCGFSSSPIDLGIINYYPNADNFDLQVIGGDCGEDPVFDIPSCGTFTLGEYLAPTDTEDGFQKYTYITGLDLSDTPECYLEDIVDGCYIIPACSECSDYSGVDASIVSPTVICNDPGDVTNVEFNISLNNNPSEIYSIVVNSSALFSQSLNYEWDSSVGDISDEMTVFVDIAGCKTSDTIVLSAEIYCQNGDFLEEIELGQVEVYGSILFYVESPGCNIGETGAAGIFGCPTSFVNGQVGDCLTNTPATLSYDIVVHEGSVCEERFTDDISIECTDCCPSIISSEIPEVICLNEEFSFCFEVDGNVDNITNIFVFDSNIPSPFEIEGNTICINTTKDTDDCIPRTSFFRVEIECTDDLTTYPLGTIDLYPSESSFFPDIQPNVNCGEPPLILPPLCGTLQLGEFVPANNDPNNPINGYQEWEVVPGFDINDAPPCFNPNFLSDSYTIFACGNCPAGHGILDPKSVGGNE